MTLNAPRERGTPDRYTDCLTVPTLPRAAPVHKSCCGTIRAMDAWAPVLVVVLAVVASHALVNREVRALQREVQRDVSALAERLAKLEGKVDTLIAAFVKPTR